MKEYFQDHFLLLIGYKNYLHVIEILVLINVYNQHQLNVYYHDHSLKKNHDVKYFN